MKFYKEQFKIFEYPEGTGVHSHHIKYPDLKCYWMVHKDHNLDEVLNRIIENDYPYQWYDKDDDVYKHSYNYNDILN